MVLLGNSCMPERGKYAAPKYDNETEAEVVAAWRRWCPLSLHHAAPLPGGARNRSSPYFPSLCLIEESHMYRGIPQQLKQGFAAYTHTSEPYRYPGGDRSGAEV